MIHNQAFVILKSLFRKKEGTQIFEEAEYNHYFLNALRIFHPEIDELWRIAAFSTRAAFEARKKIGQIFIDFGKVLQDDA